MGLIPEAELASGLAARMLFHDVDEFLTLLFGAGLDDKVYGQSNHCFSPCADFDFEAGAAAAAPFSAVRKSSTKMV